MMLELNKKEYEKFIIEIPLFLKSLEEKIKIKSPEFNLSFGWNSIEIIESYFKDLNTMNSDDIKEFWAYISETLRFYVGGDYKLAPKSEDVAFTPIIVNYGYKKKWSIRLSAEVWRDKLVKNTLPKTLVDHIKSINERYGKE
ncbi:hypothetical protein [Flavobacterium collinsii]|uniref:Uncharacterized protein n=1 Tax=Flavobacterium collinsii TaxID=1114861 RepID=A0ABN7ER79_9FLAO|nr:hypothetical protein [Flavobacterium collinsii]CAA9203298.1 hypothetical protein FLACOL7796_04683 [Flavobacterium collinsii]